MIENLATERLTLRPWQPDEAAAVLDLYSRWEVMRYLGAHPQVLAGLDQAEAKIAGWLAYPGPLHGVWAIRLDGRPIGTALLKLLPHSGSGEPSEHTEVGWHLHPDFWGHGYATEAADRLLTHAWSHGLSRVLAVTYPQNQASQAVCLRLGMTPLGLTEDYYDVTSSLFEIFAPDSPSGDKSSSSQA
ncbi:RimJ/RimL family protein N-acetyltransferase [Propionicimonas paludicola]|uniref:RimJ/RimL family protein N-acetyltransferase n=1 Tax=Propionicimonas paludicola TaxID=185243 RepID=A0A2A9CRR2_9ACTN|nr:GNAT family N-acetyltransferase [Propionicimonas paludicola]PFG16881.1 RimJ/RimL family protein N-acetyltransferase [Propionicimonas paludicola]